MELFGYYKTGISEMFMKKQMSLNCIFSDCSRKYLIESFQIASEYNVMGFETDVRIRYYVHVVSYNWLKSRSVQDILHTCMGSFCKINEICVPFYHVYIF